MLYSERFRVAPGSKPRLSAIDPSFRDKHESKESAEEAIAFTVDNAVSDLGTNAAALPNLAGSTGTGLAGDTFDWGLPFFYDRSVYVVFEGKTALGSRLVGPYVAF